MNNSQDNSFIYSTGRYYRLNVMKRYTFDKYTSSLPVVFFSRFFSLEWKFILILDDKYKDFDFLWKTILQAYKYVSRKMYDCW